jgi:signal transduction histidine kinase
MLAQRLIQSLPEPCVLVRRSGAVVAANGPAVRLLGAVTPGAAVSDLFDDPAAVARNLQQFSRSSSPQPCALALAGSGARIRCNGALVEAGPDPLLLLRLQAGESASDRFIALNERIGALNREIRERRRAQDQLQEQAVELEHIAAELEQTVEELQQQTEDATAARERAQEAADRLATLADAGAVLAGAAGYADTLQRLTEITVRTTADYCIAYIAGQDGTIHRIGGAHAAGDGGELIRQLIRDYPVAGPDSPIGEAMRSGQPLMVSSITEEMLRRAAVDETNYRILSALAPASTIIMPLPSGNGPIGAITLARGADKPAYTEDDLKVVRELARRAAVAVEHSRLLDEAQRGNKAKSAFLATMSHELRTPLNAVVGYADLLDAETSGPLMPAQRLQLGRIQSAARHLRDIIEEILLFARIEAGKEQLRPARVDLPGIIQEVIDLMRPAADERGLTLEPDAGPGGEIITDPSRLRQILLNLVANAIKFTDSGHVRVALRRVDNGAILEVQDTGIGIAEEHQEAIFEPFWQVDSSATREAGGTGLGLTVTQRLVELLGGELWVCSAPGKGSTFTVRLPATPPESA